MIIIAGSLRLAADDRARYLAAVADVAPAARRAPGCLDFVQAPDPADPERILVFERWESDADVERFRTSGDRDEPQPELPPLQDADVHRYRIASVEAP
ncbi:putative quinol monooxygenase [Blastococcus sp. VKM Ac-2987]|uniref:putative quinol monooxygenase n=1 Tax=Blastococcus sp. VKM Ac-2987 TaxID=3004141 RepID=UPI0022ABA7B2|nr:antibiotic biosynthesis monooxygenase family protein [Blastococcus sp. VKM Ac-2987]MCZ2860921.1 antibiotic biosynthesis monooxygenase [Blastococcus sp. VKM Ac-2987]